MYPQVQTDTRKLVAGELFFALSGDNFNGNQFALQAIEKGAAYAVVDEDIDPDNAQLIFVENALFALQQLAKFHRQQFNIPFIGITGSNGKTTTKELVHAVLSSHFITYTTKGNLNNHIGVSLTLLSIKKDAQMAIIEMGANHQQEIAGYCTYALPTHGVITNCGKAHLEGFGGVEGVKKGKGELFDYMRANDGTAFIFNEYNYLRQMAHDLPVIEYGTTNGDVMGTALEGEPFLQVAVTQPFAATIKTNLVGNYNLPNLLCAVAIGNHFGVPAHKIINGLQLYQPENSRSQMVISGSNNIILDAYNANPNSMALAIKNIAALQASNKVLVLGAMNELGAESLKEHQAILDLINLYSWKKVALVGGDFSKLTHTYHYFVTVNEAAEWYRQQYFKNTYQLIKGSRSYKMEQVLG